MKDFLAVTARLQSVMRDLATEMEGLHDRFGLIADEAALYHFVEETKKQEQEALLKTIEAQQRNAAIFARYEQGYAADC